MKRLIAGLAFVVLFGLGQVKAEPNNAIEYGTQEQFEMVARERNQATLEKWQWQNDRKLTVSGVIPPKPRGTLEPANLRDGSSGYLECCPYEVMKIIGPKDMLLAFHPENPHIPPIWLTDYPSKGLADGDRVRLVGLVEVDGTKSYTTAKGDKQTIRVVRLVKQKIQLKKDSNGETLWFRTWTDNSGKHTMVGHFYVLEKNLVYLIRNDNGKTIKVPMSRLTKKDQEWISRKIKSREAIKIKQAEREKEREGKRVDRAPSNQ